MDQRFVSLIVPVLLQGALIQIVVEGSGFMYRQVRNMVS